MQINKPTLTSKKENNKELWENKKHENKKPIIQNTNTLNIPFTHVKLS